MSGTSLQLQSTFALLSQALDFHGTLRLQAKVSQTTSRIKSLLLKPINPLFEREGAGTVLPIKIMGTRGEPSLRVEIGKAPKREESTGIIRPVASGWASCCYIEGIEELKPGLALQLRGRLPNPYHTTGHWVRAVNGNNFHHLAGCERDACLYSCPLRGNV